MKLSEKVFEFELEISGNEFALEVKEYIDQLETLDDVKNYYLYERSWVNDEGLVDLLMDFIINVKTE
jgi:hypothetical protein